MYKSILIISALLATTALALEPDDQVKINEIYFAGSIAGEHQDGFIELYNAGDEVAFLDGALLAQGPDTFAQIGFTFPGWPGETNLPLPPGGIVVIAIDAYNFAAGDPSSVNLSYADFETVTFGEDLPGDNPAVENMNVALDVGFDWFFEPNWGIVTLSTGQNWYYEPCEPGEACGLLIARIPLADIVDGLEYLYQLGDTLPILNDEIDGGTILGIPWNSGMSAERVNPGQDSNNSVADFRILSTPTPGDAGSLSAHDPSPIGLPRSLQITAVYPNPFNSSTEIRFELPSLASPSIQIFNVLGREVANLTPGNLSAGVHTLRWNGASDAGSAAPSGLYFVRLSDRNTRHVARVILSR